MIEHALNREWRKRELSRGERSFHSITLFTPSNDVSDLSIHYLSNGNEEREGYKYI